VRSPACIRRIKTASPQRRRRPRRDATVLGESSTGDWAKTSGRPAARTILRAERGRARVLVGVDAWCSTCSSGSPARATSASVPR